MLQKIHKVFWDCYYQIFNLPVRSRVIASRGKAGGQLPWGVLPYIGYTDMCRWKGNWSSIGSRLTGLLTKDWSQLVQKWCKWLLIKFSTLPKLFLLSLYNCLENLTFYTKSLSHFCARLFNWAFLVWYRVTKFAKFGPVEGRTFANPAVHPHPNYMGVPPGAVALPPRDLTKWL